MPRIRIRTSRGERIVGTPNCSTLTIRLIAYSQRSSVQLRADAELVGGERVLEHWTWDFPELDQRSVIELISEPGDWFDPPDASHTPKQAVPPEPQGQSIAEIQAIEKELEMAAAALKGFRPRAATPTAASGRTAETPAFYCSFCGKGQDQVRKLIAGPAVFICDECIEIARGLADQGSP